MSNSHPVRCRCGSLQAELVHPERGTRAVCYCRDCQAYAHYLALPDGMLDPSGGTDIVAVSPRYLSFVAGEDRLTCMSLTPHGTLRWFAGCCRTPIGNTPRDFRQSHLGLVHTALEDGARSLDEAFGPVRLRVHRHGTRGPVQATSPPESAMTIARYIGSLAWSRLSGRYRVNPFFDARTGQPVRKPVVLTSAEYRTLMSAG